MHDAIEWYGISREILRKEFGDTVVDIVVACTKDDTIKNPKEKIEKIIRQCVIVGKDALIVKTADIIDSYQWYTRMQNDGELQYCAWNAGDIFRLKPDSIEDKIFDELKKWYSIKIAPQAVPCGRIKKYQYMQRERPKVGLGVIVFKDGKVLLGKRKGSHGAGEYAFPGGHLEFGESFEECAKREVKEETGMEISNVRFLRLMNLKAYQDKHYVDVGLIADWKSGEPRCMEPDKCDGWQWYDLAYLPQPLSTAVLTYIEAIQTGRNYFDL